MNDQLIQKDKKSYVHRIFKSQYTYCLLVGLCVLSIIVIDYLGGYRGFHLTVFMLPALVIPGLLMIIFTLVVFIRAYMSLIKLKDIFQSAVAVLMTLAFFLPFFFLYPRPYLVGFKYKVLEISSPQELREIADKARILLKEERYLPGPNRFPQEEDYAELWEKMPKAKIFELAYSTVFINVSDNNDVLLTWGSGLVGTWGVRIAEQTVEKSKYDYNYSQIKEDIALFMEPH